MKIAYLMTVHRNPRLLERAVAMLRSEDAGFFIHVDQKADIRQFSLNSENVFLVANRVAVHWGEFSQVEATMRLLREALSSPAGYQYFSFLQGSDYPVRSARYIERFLEKHSGSEFINLRKMPAPGYPLAKVNTLRYPSEKPVRRFLSRCLAKMGFAERDYRKSLRGLEAYAGQADRTLSRSACQHMVDFASRNPGLEAYFRKAFTSDEMFFHTILGNSPFRAHARRSLTFVDPDWSDAGENRHQLREEHIRFFETRREVWIEDEWGAGEILFARKLSDDRLELADRLDAMIKLKDADCPLYVGDRASATGVPTPLRSSLLGSSLSGSWPATTEALATLGDDYSSRPHTGRAEPSAARSLPSEETHSVLCSPELMQRPARMNYAGRNILTAMQREPAIGCHHEHSSKAAANRVQRLLMNGLRHG